MLDKTAIDAIADLSAATKAATTIFNNDMEAVVIPNDYKLEGLERFKLSPDHFRGKFSTTVLAQFINYVDDNATGGSSVFIDHVKMKAKAIIDMGDHDAPQWGKHTATVELERTPAYAALIRSSDERMNQQSFIDFVEDWSDNIQFYFDNQDATGPIVTKSAIKSLRKLKTSATVTSENEIGNYAANRSAMESIEVTAMAEQPPTGFLFTTVPHDGFDAVTFECQLRAMPDAKEVFLKYRINQLPQHQEKIAEQFRDKITAGITVDSISIFIGHMDYQS